jgi:hypothetical protein
LRPTRFSHELGRGKSSRANYVNVQFRGFCSGFAKLDPIIVEDMKQAGITIQEHTDRRSGGTTLKLVLETPPVDNQESFDKNLDNIRLGILNAEKLRIWCVSQTDVLQEIFRLSQSQTTLNG